MTSGTFQKLSTEELAGLSSDMVGTWGTPGTISTDGVAIVGNGSLLFLMGGSNNYYDAYSQDQLSARAEVAPWVEHVTHLKRLCAEADVKFAFMVVPNKASVLPEFYPIPLQHKVTPRLQILLEQPGLDAGMYLQEFLKFEHRLALFRRNDSHFTETGNIVSLRLLLRQLGLDPGVMDFGFSSRTLTHPGDLGSRFEPNMVETLARLQLPAADTTINILSTAKTNVAGLVYEATTPSAVSDKRLLVIGNSFMERAESWALSPYLVRLFRHFKFCWSTEFKPDLVTDFAPDYIVFQTCERFLGRPPSLMGIAKLPPRVVSVTPRLAASAPSTPIAAKVSGMMRIALATNGTLHFSGAVKEPTTFYSGTTLLGSTTPDKNAFPMHALGEFADQVKKYGISAVPQSGRYVETVDVTDFVISYLGEDKLLHRLQEAVGPGKWSVYAVYPDRTKGHVTAHIGVVLPNGLAGKQFWFECDGVVAESMAIYADPHFGVSHWFMPAGQVLGVQVKFQLKAVPDFISFDMKFDESAGKLGKAFRSEVRLTTLDLLRGLPDEKRIKRVSGASANDIGFLNGGRSAWTRLVDVSREYGTDIRNKPARVLDWGVGCGRVASHMATIPSIDLHGADIDSDNIAWCSNNLRGKYTTVKLMPPTPYAKESFDLIYSCSVLSHLTEDVADAWLAEMARVLRPSGLALLSFNGSSNTASYLSRRPDEIRRTFKSELFDRDVNRDLEGFIGSDDYYRATFASDAWWKAMLQRHFKVEAVESAVVSGYQDLAVLRRK